MIEQAFFTVTNQPIRWVVNIGAQDHHWLGNQYFANKGAQIIALARTVETQRAHVDGHLRRLRVIFGAEAEKVVPIYSPNPVDEDRHKLHIGGLELELIWPGNGHFPGDTLLWVPRQEVVFAGDFVFNDRILGIHPFSSVAEWQSSFHAIAALQPTHVVPEHGHPGDLPKATRDTGITWTGW